MCEKLSAAGVDMIEVNISCPNVKAGDWPTAPGRSWPPRSRRSRKKTPTVPVMVKLSPNVTDITEIAGR